MQLKDFVKFFSIGLHLDLYIDGEPALFCPIESAVRILSTDKRGILIVPEGSVSTYTLEVGYAGIYKKCLRINCNSS